MGHNYTKGGGTPMTSLSSGAVPTRLVDLSALSLRELGRCDPEGVARVCAPLVREVSEPAVVSLGGSDS